MEVKTSRRSSHDGLSRTLRDLPVGPGDVTGDAGDASEALRPNDNHDRERTRPMVTKALLTTGDAHTTCAMAGAAA
jgi:hypothetical protein